MEKVTFSYEPRFYSNQDAYKLREESEAQLKNGEIDERTFHLRLRKVSEILTAVELAQIAQMTGQQDGTVEYTAEIQGRRATFIGNVGLTVREMEMKLRLRLLEEDPHCFINPLGVTRSSGQQNGAVTPIEINSDQPKPA